MTWYRTGTVALVSGQTAITGTGTQWLTKTKAGDALLGPDGKLYELLTVVSDTQATLATAYAGASAPATPCVIVPTQSITRLLSSQVSELIALYAAVPESIANALAGSVRSAVLTGLSTATSTVVAAADSVLVAIGKLQAQMGLKANLSGAAFTGTVSTTEDLSAANFVYVGGSGNGRMFGKNSGGVAVMEVGVAAFSGYSDSVGLGAVSPAGQLDLGTNSISRVTIMGDGDTKVNYGRLLLTGHPTTASAANCHIDAGGLIYRSTSSARYKKDVEALDASIAESIYDMRPVWFRSTNNDDPEDWSWLGLIAEEVAQVEPRLAQWAYLPDAWNPAEDVVTYDEDGNELRSPGVATLKEGAKKVPDGVQYDRFVVPLIACMQQQRKDIEALQARITALESKQ